MVHWCKRTDPPPGTTHPSKGGGWVLGWVSPLSQLALFLPEQTPTLSKIKCRSSLCLCIFLWNSWKLDFSFKTRWFSEKRKQLERTVFNKLAQGDVQLVIIGRLSGRGTQPPLFCARPHPQLFFAFLQNRMPRCGNVNVQTCLLWPQQQNLPGAIQSRCRNRILSVLLHILWYQTTFLTL